MVWESILEMLFFMEANMESPCKDCVCFPVCVAESSLHVLLKKCSYLRRYYFDKYNTSYKETPYECNRKWEDV